MKCRARFARLGIVALLLLGAGIWALKEEYKEPPATPGTIVQRLEKAGDLAAAKMEYRGLVRFEEGGVRFLTRKAFTMLYTARVRAGVDLTEAEVDLKGSVVWITLPAAVVQEVTIDPKSLAFYDEHSALLNPDSPADTAEALKTAERDAREWAQKSELCQEANRQTKRLCEELLAPILQDPKRPLRLEFDEES